MDNLNQHFPVGEANARVMKLFMLGNVLKGRAWIVGNTATEVQLIGNMPHIEGDPERRWVIAGEHITARADDA